MILISMDAYITESKSIKRKIDNLEYTVYACRSNLDKIKKDLRYYTHVTESLMNNIIALKNGDVVVSMYEYKKILEEYKFAANRVDGMISEALRLDSMIRDSESRRQKLLARKEFLDNIINNARVVLLFKKR